MRTLVHLSDLHFGRLDPRVLTPLVRRIEVVAPDLIAVSGDLTQRARRAEFAAARAFFAQLRFPTLIVPGNHDVPLYNVAARFLNPLARYRRYIADELEPVFLDEEMIVVGLNSARSLSFGSRGSGRLNEDQVDRAAAHLRSAAPHLIKIIVTHHPFDLPEGLGDEHLVGQAHTAMGRLASVGADLFLAGHLHVSHIGRTAERYKIDRHAALVVQAGTLSTRGRGELNSFNILHLARPHITIERHRWDEEHQTFLPSWSGTFQHSQEGWT
jgi:3',5'-cyclic AMP phosphodiesterase CpdA